MHHARGGEGNFICSEEQGRGCGMLDVSILPHDRPRRCVTGCTGVDGMIVYGSMMMEQ